MNKSFFSTHLVALLGCLLLAFPLVSCIDDEQPSMEADIEQVSVQGVAAQRLFNNAADAQRTVLSQDTAIVFHLADGVEDATLDSIKLDSDSHKALILHWLQHRRRSLVHSAWCTMW